MCLAVPAAIAFLYAVDALVGAPWAYPISSRSTLTGTWVSEFAMPSGTRFALFLDLRHPLLTNAEPQGVRELNGLITGQASWCDDRGRHGDDIPLQGYVPVLTGYHGSASKVQIDLQSTRHPQPGLQPVTFSGAWDSDALVLESTFFFWDSQAQVLVNNPDVASRPTIVAQKTNEAWFRAACAGLAGGTS